MPRACWGSQCRSGRSQRRSSRFTLQFRWRGRLADSSALYPRRLTPRPYGGGCPRKPAAVHGASRRSVGGGCGRDSSYKSRWGDRLRFIVNVTTTLVEHADRNVPSVLASLTKG